MLAEGLATKRPFDDGQDVFGEPYSVHGDVEHAECRSEKAVASWRNELAMLGKGFSRATQKNLMTAMCLAQLDEMKRGLYNTINPGTGAEGGRSPQLYQKQR